MLGGKEGFCGLKLFLGKLLAAGAEVLLVFGSLTWDEMTWNEEGCPASGIWEVCWDKPIPTRSRREVDTLG